MLKFAIITLPDFQYFPYGHLPFDFTRGVTLIRGPLKNSLSRQSIAHWKKWLGTIKWGEIENCKAFFFITLQSQTPTVADREGIVLANNLNNAYLALMISAPFRPVRGSSVLIGGAANLNGQIIDVTHISSASEYNEWVQSHYTYARGYHAKKNSRIKTRSILEQARDTFVQLDDVAKDRKRNAAVLLAVESLRLGLEASYLDFRIPFFIRASEAIMAPKRFQTKAAFVTRSKKLLRQIPAPLFISKKTNIDALLDDLFEIRNGCAHGMPFGWKVPKRIKSKRRLEQYAYLSEESARRAIKYALGNKSLLKAARNRTKLEAWCEANW